MTIASYLIEEALTRTIGDYVTVSAAGDLNYCCPKCPDGDNNYHMGVSFEKYGGVFNCWRCGYKGKLRRLIRDLGLAWDELNDPSKIPAPTDEALVAEVEALFSQNKPIDENTLPAVYPEGYRAIGSWMPKKYKKYIKERCSIKAAHRYKLGVCLTGQFMGRVIVPYHDSIGFLRYYTARAIRKPRSESALKLYRKYLNPSNADLNGVGKAQVLFGADKIKKKTKRILVMEGAFDVLRFATYTDYFPNTVAVAIGGKALSATQRGILQQAGKKREVVMMLDPDARCEAQKYALALSTVVRNVTVATLLGEKDPGDMNYSDFKETLATREAPKPLIIEDSELLKFLEN